MRNPPPPARSYGRLPSPPPPGGGMPRPGGGMPSMMPAGGGGAMAVPGNLASTGMRIVGGLIDVVILAVVNGIISTILQKLTGLAGLINIVIDVAYFGYFWSSRGASIGMMPFGFKVRDMQTGQYPTMGKAALRGFIWVLEVGFTVCIIVAICWLWRLRGPQKPRLHDQISGTRVTTN